MSTRRNPTARRITAPGHTYIINLKKDKIGDTYLVITQLSPVRPGRWDKSIIRVSADIIPDFIATLNEVANLRQIL